MKNMIGVQVSEKPTKRGFLFFSILVGAILTAGFISNSEEKEKQWNVLLISIDTIRPDRLGCYSTEYIQTPHIDALASRGVLFERAFAHNPMTLPSHVNMMMGTTPLYHGVHENSNSILHEDFCTLAEYLKEKGYATGAFIGAFPLDSRFGLSQGFDVYDESYPSKASSAFVYQERTAGQVIQAALNWLERQDLKWFSFIHIWDPHAPYSPPEPFNTKFKDDPYSGEVAYVDSELGKIFDYLNAKKLMENTLIVLTGDHGEALGEHGESTHGYFAYNSTLWIPLIIAVPQIKARRIDEYVCHTDIFPTICDILGVNKPTFLQGVSLLPLMKGGKIESRAIYFESLAPYLNRGWAPLRGFIEDKKKFLDSPLPEYYNLEDDFHERKNLIQKIDLERHRKKMEELIDKFACIQKKHTLQRTDRETRKRLRSLGYISSPVTQINKGYRPEDDLKNLLPFQQKHFAALSFLENGRIQEAVKLLNDIIQEKEDFTGAYIDLCNIYERQGLEEEALSLMESGYKNNPESYGIVTTYAFLLVKQGRLDKGIVLLKKAINIIDYDPEVWTYLGIAYTHKGEFQKALESYEKAHSLDENDALIYSNMGFLHFSIFLRTKKVEDHARALESYKTAVKIDPSLASAYNGLGSTYKVIGQIDKAVTCWEIAVELDPDYDFPIFNLGVIHLQKGNKSRALEYFERYLVLKNDTLPPDERREIEAYIRKCKE
jgi:arylsulfatase A-like enzyme/tetratricopeptide (TPR) repeat protein